MQAQERHTNLKQGENLIPQQYASKSTSLQKTPAEETSGRTPDGTNGTISLDSKEIPALKSVLRFLLPPSRNYFDSNRLLCLLSLDWLNEKLSLKLNLEEFWSSGLTSSGMIVFLHACTKDSAHDDVEIRKIDHLVRTAMHDVGQTEEHEISGRTRFRKTVDRILSSANEVDWVSKYGCDIQNFLSSFPNPSFLEQCVRANEECASELSHRESVILQEFDEEVSVWEDSSDDHSFNLQVGDYDYDSGSLKDFTACDQEYWREDLKPPVHNPTTIVPQKRNQPNRTIQDAGSTLRQLDSMRSGSRSPASPIFQLKTPRPDICVGLSDDSLAIDMERIRGRSSARSLLFDLQDTTSLISDPHVTPVGLRFPFLIIEAKSGATGGNLYQAQNQAAVGGSAALQLLRNLWDFNNAEDPEIVNVGDTGGTQSSLEHMPHLVFSFTTEGPIHELWLHFRRPADDDFYMSCMGTWRTTLKNDSLNLVLYLKAILQWGNSDFRSAIVGVLNAL
ncbi:hypothetical protein AFGD_012604 [Aspergillus flavus]|nr:hypothetical protein AFGD_012604 [Aspergillus flavus]